MGNWLERKEMGRGEKGGRLEEIENRGEVERKGYGNMWREEDGKR